MRARRPVITTVATTVICVVATTLTAACSPEEEIVSDVSAFCARAVDQSMLIVDPPMSTEAELQASIEFYRLMGQLAPVSIAEEWNVLVAAMETASTVVPGNQASEQLAAMTAYATEPSAFRVKEWMFDVCGLDLPITTIAPQAATPARTLEQVTPDPTTDRNEEGTVAP